jgi:hypothetical protein
MADRLIFPSGKQKEFMLAAQERLGLSWAEIATRIDAHPRSVRDWAREKNRISERAAKQLAKVSGIEVPSSAVFLSWNDHLRQASREGWRQLREKYGSKYRIPINEEYRKKRWKEWWEETGQYLPFHIDNQPLPFNKPKFSKDLAEFVGIMLGDGGISKYQLVITLHRIDDAAYSVFVRNLILKLFGISAGKHQIKNALADNIIISRIGLVNYCVHELGLKIGNKVKQQIDIPLWIKQDTNLLMACIRGLVDTDGSVFTHRYSVKGKEYKYKKISFTSASNPLGTSVYNAFLKLGIRARLAGGTRAKNIMDVRLDSKGSVAQYFNKIGSHNPKHLKRYTA